jgi:Peroxiredoxin
MNLKQLTLILCLTSVSLLGYGQKTSSSYTVAGNISGIPDGTTIELKPFVKDIALTFAPAVVKNGTFVFNGKVAEPRLVYLVVNNEYAGLNFMLENTKISITGTISDVQSGYHCNAKVSGSSMTDLYLQKISIRDTLNQMYTKYNEDYKEGTDLMNKARTLKDKALIDSVSNTESWKNFEKAEKEFFQTAERKYTNLFKSNGNSFWGPMLMISMMNYLSPDMRPVYEAFSQQAKNSYYGKLVKAELYPVSMIGQKVPVFSVKDTDGKIISLASLLKGKRYLLIDFWASWCAPCRREIPNLKELYKKFADKGFQIVSISIDKKEIDWKKALTEEKLAWPNFRDVDVVPDKYKIKSIPAMFLIDSRGVLVSDNARGKILAEKLDELLK